MLAPTTPPREPRPEHRRRGSYYPPLPPRLNPSPNPSTMASKLLNSNGSNSSKQAEAKTWSTPPPPSRAKSQPGAVEHWSGRAHRYSSGSEDVWGRRRLSLERDGEIVAGSCSAAARVAVVALPATISTVRKRKGLAFPVPRTILLVSLIEANPNCAPLMGFHLATLRTRFFFLHSLLFSLSLCR